jgi:hypothetical protein
MIGVDGNPLDTVTVPAESEKNHYEDFTPAGAI